MPLNMLPDDAELLELLLRMELGLSIENYLTFHTLREHETIKVRNYEIKAVKNKHMPDGSFSYKIMTKSDKLKVEKAKEYLKEVEPRFHRTLEKMTPYESVDVQEMIRSMPANISGS